jgi:hypothetical protein
MPALENPMKQIPAVVLLALFLAGCPAQGPYHDAVVVEHQAKTLVQAFQQAEIAEFNAGRIALAEHQLIESKFAIVGQAGSTITLALQQGAAQTTVLGDFNVLLQAVQDLNAQGVLGVKNAQSQAVLATALKGLQDVIANLGTILGAPTTTPPTAVGPAKAPVSLNQLLEPGAKVRYENFWIEMDLVKT